MARLNEHGDVGKLEQLVESLPGENRLVVVAGAEHFFAGKAGSGRRRDSRLVTQRHQKLPTSSCNSLQNATGQHAAPLLGKISAR